MSLQSIDNPIISALLRAYNAELETVQNYLANSVNLDGVRARQIADALAVDIPVELGHAQLIAKRVKTIGGVVPGSYVFKAEQESLQPPRDTTDVVAVIKGVIAAEEGAIRMYNEVIRVCEGKDYATQDMAITILADEEEHRREFVGFLKEYERKG